MNTGLLPSTEEWLRNHHPEMVDCPHQPGRLRISKEACKRRTLASRKIKIFNNDILMQAGRKGLLLCRKCNIGNELVSGSGEKRKSHRARRNHQRNSPERKFFHPQPTGSQGTGGHAIEEGNDERKFKRTLRRPKTGPCGEA
jgi:hypothetical protein